MEDFESLLLLFVKVSSKKSEVRYLTIPHLYALTSVIVNNTHTIVDMCSKFLVTILHKFNAKHDRTGWLIIKITLRHISRVRLNIVSLPSTNAQLSFLKNCQTLYRVLI